MVDRVNEVLAAVSAFYQAQAAAKGQALRGMAILADPDWEAETLSQTAVRALRTTAGVASVLVGMRRAPYVHDVIRELARPAEAKPRAAAWATIKRAMKQSST